MFYYTTPQKPIYHQITLEEILNGTAETAGIVRSNETNTKTILTNKYDKSKFGEDRVNYLIDKLEKLINDYDFLYKETDRHKLYHSFKIPKKSGGLRKIDAPLSELSGFLTQLKTIFENDFGALYHTSAFAYVKGRCTIDSIKRHQLNDSYWFLKTDLTDFFGSTTKEFAMNTLAQIFPFNLVCANDRGKQVLDKAIDLAFLDGGLPQGTPFSPMLTNLLMIPVDHKLQNTLRSFNKQSYIYTRYADDMLISSHYSFKFKDVVDLINSVLKECGTPYQIKDKKTRYGSRNGSNWNLGVMLNKDNEITIGHEKKKVFRAMLVNYTLDRKNGIAWSLEDIQHVQGLMSYYKMIESEYVDSLIDKINAKHNVDILQQIKTDLSV